MTATAAALEAATAAVAHARKTLDWQIVRGRDSSSCALDLIDAKAALAAAAAAHDAAKAAEGFQLALDFGDAPAEAEDPFAGLEGHSGRVHGRADYAHL